MSSHHDDHRWLPRNDFLSNVRPWLGPRPSAPSNLIPGISIATGATRPPSRLKLRWPTSLPGLDRVSARGDVTTGSSSTTTAFPRPEFVLGRDRFTALTGETPESSSTTAATRLITHGLQAPRPDHMVAGQTVQNQTPATARDAFQAPMVWPRSLAVNRQTPPSRDSNWMRPMLDPVSETWNPPYSTKPRSRELLSLLPRSAVANEAIPVPSDETPGSSTLNAVRSRRAVSNRVSKHRNYVVVAAPPSRRSRRTCVTCATDKAPNAFCRISGHDHARETCRLCIRKWITSQIESGTKWDELRCSECNMTFSHENVKSLCIGREFEQ